jgi:Xaa-Pro aminopeptidase
MKLFSTQTYINRRSKLKELVKSGQILLLGNNESPMNYTDNTYRFKQDSSFLYFFGINLPGLSAIIDLDKNTETIFGNEYAIEDIIWIGNQESLASLAKKVGVNTVEKPSKLASNITKNIKFLPPYRFDNKQLLSELLNIKVSELKPDNELTKAVISIRSFKSEEEILEMNDAINITGAMHLAAMKATKPGKMEYEVVAKIMETLHSSNAELSYPVIFSINGQTLHNHYHGNKMLAGQIAINDSGAENSLGYAGDITRTIPVSGVFNIQQKEIYETVLKMEMDSISLLKSGISYRDVHINANKILLESLKNIGLVKGNIEDMLSEGVGGLFMPHGLGHMIGMDVHDMEDLGENFVGYTEDMERSTQLGLKSLRLAKALEPGFVITVEPGCYFIPELIEKYKSEGKFIDFVNYESLEKYKNFGGIRIEDDVLITENGSKVLGNPIPKTIQEIEDIMKSQ